MVALTSGKIYFPFISRLHSPPAKLFSSPPARFMTGLVAWGHQPREVAQLVPWKIFDLP